METTPLHESGHADLRPNQADAFREAMRGFAATVVLISTLVEGRPWGVTVTSVCSLSIRPPRLIVSLMRRSTACQSIATAGHFGANVLAPEQVTVARFGAKPGEPKFLDASLLSQEHQTAQSPVLVGALAHIQCQVAEVFDGGDHDIIVGDVIEIVGGNPSGKSPLVYFDGGFRHLGTPVEAPASWRPANVAGAPSSVQRPS